MKKKKTLSLTLALTLSLSLLTVSAGAASSPSAWAQEGVEIAVARGLVPAALQDQYDQPITRGEFTSLAVTFYENYTGSEITARAEFTDTSDVNVQKAAGLGVVTGVGDGRFDPDAGLTREQAATMLSRLSTAVGYSLPGGVPSFNDSASISSWASEAVGQMQSSGIMGGTGDNLFSPAVSYTREQSILTVLRLYDLAAGNVDPTPPASTPAIVPENEIDRMLRNPNYYVGQYVDRMPAQIFNIPESGMYLQVKAGPNEINTYITLNDQTTLAEGDYVLISGTVIGPYSYTTIANQTRTVANIAAGSVELTTKDAIDAANQAQTLATHGVTINLPATPITVQEHDFSDNRVATYQITAIDMAQEYHEYRNEVTVTLSFTGECTGRYTNTDTNCQIIWTLTDTEGYKIDSGSAYSPILADGDKFRNVEVKLYELEPSQTYNLEISTSIK